MTIYLVSCVSQKATTAKPAQDLYLSNWFYEISVPRIGGSFSLQNTILSLQKGG